MAFFASINSRAGMLTGRPLWDAFKKLAANFGLLEPGTTDSGAADYALVLANMYKTVTRSRATAQTLTVPTNATVPFPIGTQIPAIQTGAGALTIQAAGGVTLQQLAAKTLVVAGQHGRVVLTKIAANTWNVSGDLTAA